MSRNYKQQAQYDYLHNNKPVKGKLLWSILNKFWRHNADMGFYRQLRNKIRYNKEYETRRANSTSEGREY